MSGGERKREQCERKREQRERMRRRARVREKEVCKGAGVSQREREDGHRQTDRQTDRQRMQ